MALFKFISKAGTSQEIWLPLAFGAIGWVVLFLIIPKPMWLYVTGHELTHAIWVKLFGGSVKSMQISAEGGNVVVDRNNFLISLAPYFFPFYVFLVVGIYSIGNWIWNWTPHAQFFYALVGITYAFHVTLTLHILRAKQSDITSQGWLFSAVVIFLGNVIVLLIGLPLLTEEVPLPKVCRWWWVSSIDAYGWVYHTGATWISRIRA